MKCSGKAVYNTAMKKAILTIVLTVIWVFMVGFPQRADVNPTASELTYTGVWGSGPCVSTEYDGTYIYYLGYRTGLEILDISEPERPIRISGVYVPSHPQGEIAAERELLVKDGYGYITAYYYNQNASILQIVDLSNPLDPLSAGHRIFDGRLTGLAVNNGYAYISLWEGGVKIFDVHNPSAPMMVGSYFIDGITNDVTTGTKDNLIYAVNTNSLRIINVSAPTMPVMVGTYTLTDNDISSVAIGENGDYAYIGGYGGLVTVDITDPSAPRETNFYQLPYIHDIKIKNSTAYVSASSSVYLLDITSPSSPMELGSWRAFQSVMSAVPAEGYLYAANYADGLRVLDISDMTGPQETGAYNQVSEEMFGVTARDSMLYALHSSNVYVIDAGNASNPYLTGESTYSGTSANSIRLQDQYAYHASTSGIRILDISNPRQPEVIGQYSSQWYKTYGLALRDNIAYTVRIGDRLDAIDISDPTNPEAVSSLEDIAIGGISIYEDYAYVISSAAGLHVIDISNPQSMVLLTVIPVNVPAETPGWWDTLVIEPLIRDNYMYIPGHRGLEVLDIHNPAVPVPTALGATNQTATAAAIDNQSAYVVLKDGAVNIFDIGQPESPRLTGTLTLPYGARQIYASENHLYITSLNGQVHIYSTASCSSALVDGPAAGKICAVGSIQEISWAIPEAGPADSTVNLELYQDNHRIAVLAENLPASSGTYSWATGAAADTNILIEPGERFNIGVRWLKNNCLTLSKEQFTIPETGVSLAIETTIGTDSSFLLSRRGVLIDITVNLQPGAAEISRYILKRRFDLGKYEQLAVIDAAAVQNGNRHYTYFDSITEGYFSHEYYVEAIHPTGAIIAVSDIKQVNEY